MRITIDTTTRTLGTVAGLLALVAVAGCDSRAVSNGDGGPGSDGAPTADSGPAPGCTRPTGTCISHGDCEAGEACVPWDGDGQCRQDPCSGFGPSAGASDDESDRAAPENPAQPGSPPDSGVGFAPPPCLGRCEAVTCNGNAECGAGAFCDIGGDCAYPGTCRPRPTSCAGSSSGGAAPGGSGEPSGDEAPGFAPPDSGADERPMPADGGAADPMPPPPPDDPPLGGVCSCDGLDYGSVCEAEAAGVSVAYPGPCGMPPVEPFCADNGECAADQYCKMDGFCQATGAKMGTCTPRPTGCPFLAAPDWHCGCDGTSYMSACEAARQGVNVDYAGGCAPAPGTSCAVIDDCCSCEAIDTMMGKPAPCPAACAMSKCAQLGFNKPEAYELDGRCLLTDGAVSCASDGDCYLLSDCCSCGAFPLYVDMPSCVDCGGSVCSDLGFGLLWPKCIGGRCVAVN